MLSMSGAKPHVMPHQVVSCITNAILAFTGLYLWCVAPDASLDGSRELRTRAHSESSASLTALMCGFQLYGISIALVFEPSLRGKHGFEMLGHHVISLLLTVLGLAYTYLHFYAPFFMGAVELSSIPLGGVDCFKQFKQLRPRFPLVYEASRVAFSLSFIGVRVLYWPYISWAFWHDSLHEMRATDAAAIPSWVVLTFLLCNLLLTALQMYWGSIVIRALATTVRGALSSGVKERGA